MDVVVREILATLVAYAASVPSGTPFRAVDLEDAETEARGGLRAGDQPRVHPALALHQADPVADQGPLNFGSLQLLHSLALR